jgi:hypothetical protein
LNHTSSPFCCGYFGDGVLRGPEPWSSQITLPPKDPALTPSYSPWDALIGASTVQIMGQGSSQWLLCHWPQVPVTLKQVSLTCHMAWHLAMPKTAPTTSSTSGGVLSFTQRAYKGWQCSPCSNVLAIRTEAGGPVKPVLDAKLEGAWAPTMFQPQGGCFQRFHICTSTLYSRHSCHVLGKEIRTESRPSPRLKSWQRIEVEFDFCCLQVYQSPICTSNVQRPFLGTSHSKLTMAPCAGPIFQSYRSEY